MRKSPGLAASSYSVAVAVTTSTSNVVERTGSRLTVTGTFSVPPSTFSATEAL